MNTRTTTTEQYVAFVKWRDSDKRFPLFSQTSANTLEKAKERFEEHIKTWHYSDSLDYNDVEFRHRTVITTTSEWEVVG